MLVQDTSLDTVGVDVTHDELRLEVIAVAVYQVDLIRSSVERLEEGHCGGCDGGEVHLEV